MAALLYILAKLVLLTSLLECAHTYNDSAGMSPPPQQLSLPYSRIKLGRKDKCRHAVRKEVRRYSGQVRALTSRLSQLQKDIAQLRGEHNRKHQELESLKFNMSSQTRLLQETMQSLHDLQESVDQLEGKKKWQPAVPADCDQVYQAGGIHYAGTYQVEIKPKTSEKPFTVVCEPWNGAGWTVVQQRTDGEVNFRRTWQDYRDGFGRLQAEFWLGNDPIHAITTSGNYTLRVELEEFSGTKYWAEYSHFQVDGPEANYRLHISGYSGDAGDTLTGAYHSVNGAQFSTYDRDNDEKYDNCAGLFSGGWWYSECGTSNINGKYQRQGQHFNLFEKSGIVWRTIHSFKSLKATKMMVRPGSESIDSSDSNGSQATITSTKPT